MMDEDAVLAELAGLRDLFRADLGAIMDRMDAAWAAWQDKGGASEHEELVRQVHSLAGTSGAFGLSAISEAAGRLEDKLDAVPAGQPTPHDFGPVMLQLRQEVRSAG